MEEKTVHIPAISCGHCIMAIKRELGVLEGVVSVDGDLGSKKVTVRWKAPLAWDTIGRTLAEIGYPPEE